MCRGWGGVGGGGGRGWLGEGRGGVTARENFGGGARGRVRDGRARAGPFRPAGSLGAAAPEAGRCRDLSRWQGKVARARKCRGRGDRWRVARALWGGKSPPPRPVEIFKKGNDPTRWQDNYSTGSGGAKGPTSARKTRAGTRDNMALDPDETWNPKQ